MPRVSNDASRWHLVQWLNLLRTLPQMGFLIALHPSWDQCGLAAVYGSISFPSSEKSRANDLPFFCKDGTVLKLNISPLQGRSWMFSMSWNWLITPSSTSPRIKEVWSTLDYHTSPTTSLIGLGGGLAEAVSGMKHEPETLLHIEVGRITISQRVAQPHPPELVPLRPSTAKQLWRCD